MLWVALRSGCSVGELGERRSRFGGHIRIIWWRHAVGVVFQELDRAVLVAEDSIGGFEIGGTSRGGALARSRPAGRLVLLLHLPASVAVRAWADMIEAVFPPFTLWGYTGGQARAG